MKTLAMMKMEKNFIAQIDKHYPRKPYEHYSLNFLRKRLLEEMNELNEVLKTIEAMKSDVKPLFILTERETLIENAKLECADVSNVVDYIFEKLLNDAEKKKRDI